MNNERSQILKLHELIVKKRQSPPTTYSPYNQPLQDENNDIPKRVDYGRLSGVISGEGNVKGETK